MTFPLVSNCPWIPRNVASDLTFDDEESESSMSIDDNTSSSSSSATDQTDESYRLSDDDEFQINVNDPRTGGYLMPKFTQIMNVLRDNLESTANLNPDIMYSVILVLLLFPAKQMSVQNVLWSLMLPQDCEETVSACFRYLATLPHFSQGLSGMQCITAEWGHQYADSACEQDVEILQSVHSKIFERLDTCTDPDILLFAKSTIFRDRDPFGMDDHFEEVPDDDDDDDEEPSQTISRIAQTFSAAVEKPSDDAAAKTEMDTALSKIRSAYESALEYVSLVRKIDKVSMISKKEPRAMECMVQHILEEMDGHLEVLRGVLGKHVGYTSADVNGRCVICQSSVRDPASLMCGHVLCMACVSDPKFAKDRQTFFETAAVTCPTCNKNVTYTKLYI